MVFLGSEEYESPYIPNSVLSPINSLNSLQRRMMTSVTPFISSSMYDCIWNECMKK